MRLFLIPLLLYLNLYCDTPVNIDDLPLAKTYPVDKPVKNEITKKKLPANIKESIDELRKSMPAKVVKTGSENDSTLNKYRNSDMKKRQSDFEYYVKFLQDNPRISLVLLSSLLSLILLFWFFSRGKKSDDESDEDIERERLSKMFSEFLNFKGKIHEQFIIRKQNILFNNDFTQYQKAKALLDLEKEYNDLEFFQIAKLLCSDFPQFVKAAEVLTSKPELRDVVSEYIEETMHYRDYTKEQKRILREKIKNYYQTSRHTWEYEKSLETNAKKEQTAYLLQ